MSNESSGSFTSNEGVNAAGYETSVSTALTVLQLFLTDDMKNAAYGQGAKAAVQTGKGVKYLTKTGWDIVKRLGEYLPTGRAPANDEEQQRMDRAISEHPQLQNEVQKQIIKFVKDKTARNEAIDRLHTFFAESSSRSTHSGSQKSDDIPGHKAMKEHFEKKHGKDSEIAKNFEQGLKDLFNELDKVPRWIKEEAKRKGHGERDHGEPGSSGDT